MININDETLNRFLDNELGDEEKNFVKIEIEKSATLKKRYETLLFTHSQLKNIQPDSTSLDFNSLVMQKISKRGVIEAEQKRFLFLVLSILGIIILGIVGYVFYQIINTIQMSDSNNSIVAYSNTIGDYFSSLLGKKSLSIIGSVLSFTMLVSGYFLYDHKRQLRKYFGH